MSILNAYVEEDELGGGNIRQIINPKPIAFERGIWRYITNQIVNLGDQAFGWGVDEYLQFRVRPSLTGSAPVLRIGKGEDSATFTPLNTNNVEGTISGNKITFMEAWNNCDLSFSVIGHKVKNDIFLRTGHPQSYSFRINDRTGSGLRVEQPFLTNGDVVIPLEWIVTHQNGKEIWTVTLPPGNWAGWVLDPTFNVQPDGGAGMDTRIVSDNPTYNYGTTATLGIGSASGADRKLLIQFNLSSLPPAAQISLATLSLRTNAVTSMSIYRGLTQWWEGDGNGAALAAGHDGSTYNLRNNNGSVSWGSAGGQSGVDYAALPTDTRNTVSNNFVGFVVTADIQPMLTANYGWWGIIPGAVTINIPSSDNAAAVRPKLTIDYTLPGGTRGIITGGMIGASRGIRTGGKL